jgi:hypothetical protein
MGSSVIPSIANEIHFRLPVRVFEPEEKSIALKKDDFNLFINDSQREIIDSRKRIKSLGIKPDLGRDFIFSFYLTEYGRNVEDGISYLITEILDTSDSLYILSPGKFYKIKVSKNKERMRMTLEELLRKDCKEFKKDRISAENKLINKINALKRNFSADLFGVNRNFNQRRYVKTSHFLNSFPDEFLDFKNRYLFPDVSNYQQVIEPLVMREGERWWIHFQQNETLELFPKLKEVIKQINSYINDEEDPNQTLAQVLKRNLSRLEKHMLISNSFPAARLLNTFVGNDISYNVVFFKSSKNKKPNVEYSALSGLEDILKEISSASGGKTVKSVNSEQGVKEIEKHLDQYYEIIYNWDGKIEGKKIHVSVDKRKINLSYNDNIRKEKVRSSVRFFSKEKHKINIVSIDNNILTFYISSFESEKAGKYGLLKIRVELFDEQNVNIHKNENTLRASKEKVTISIPIPAKLRGEFRLAITVCDLIANSSVSDERRITL